MLSLNEICLRYLLAAVISWVVGYERYTHGRPAGFRTNSLVCLASVTLMIVSQEYTHYMTTSYGILSQYLRIDPGRIAAGTVAGIGFIGAGVIVKMGGSVYGLTTAATIWILSAIGLAIGAGMYWVGIIAFLFTIGPLIFFRKFENLFLIKRDLYRKMTVSFRGTSGFLDDLKMIFAQCQLSMVTRNEEINLEKQTKTYQIILHGQNEKSLNSTIRKVAELDDVIKVTTHSQADL